MIEVNVHLTGERGKQGDAPKCGSNPKTCSWSSAVFLSFSVLTHPSDNPVQRFVGCFLQCGWHDSSTRGTAYPQAIGDLILELVGR